MTNAFGVGGPLARKPNAQWTNSLAILAHHEPVLWLWVTTPCVHFDDTSIGTKGFCDRQVLLGSFLVPYHSDACVVAVAEIQLRLWNAFLGGTSDFVLRSLDRCIATQQHAQATNLSQSR